jgi:hypothetical protein
VKKKEYGRTYSGLRKVKRRRQIKQRDLMIEGTKKMELNAKKKAGNTVWEFDCSMEAKMERVRRGKEIRRWRGLGNQTTINLRDVLLRNNSGVEATTTSESHRRDAHGRGFRRKR